MTKFKYQPHGGLYDAYYTQKGGNYPIFQGALITKGYGIGGLISGLARIVMPLVRKILPVISRGAKHGLPLIKRGVKYAFKKNALPILESGAKYAIKSGAKSLSNVMAKKRLAAAQHKEIEGKLAEIMKARAIQAKSGRKRKRKPTIVGGGDIFG